MSGMPGSRPAGHGLLANERCGGRTKKNAAANLLDDFEAVAARHVDVEKHDVGLLATNCGDRFESIAVFADDLDGDIAGNRGLAQGAKGSISTGRGYEPGEMNLSSWPRWLRLRGRRVPSRRTTV